MKQLNWNKIKAVSLIIGSLGFVSFGFQNCSKVGVQDLGSPGDSSKLGDNNCAGCSDGDGAGDLPDGSHPGGNTGSNPGGKNPAKDPNKQPLDEYATLVALCLQKEGVPLAGPDIIDVNGNTTVNSDDINVISIVNGNLKLQGVTASAKAKLIEHVNGNALLCGVDVESVDDIHGNLILVNSHVAKVSNIKNSLRLFNSRADDIYIVNGNVDVRNGSSIGSTSKVNGNIR